MKLLLDTHIAFWTLSDDERLSDYVRKLILDDKNEIYFSAISVLETELKFQIHPERVPLSGEALATLCQEAGYKELPLKANHIFKMGTLQYKEGAPPHKDPFDKVLICQAKTEHMKLLTHDSLIPNYGESCVISV